MTMDYQEFLQATAPLKRMELENARTILEIVYNGLERESPTSREINGYANTTPRDLNNKTGLPQAQAENLISVSQDLLSEEEKLVRDFAKTLADFYKKADREMAKAMDI